MYDNLYRTPVKAEVEGSGIKTFHPVSLYHQNIVMGPGPEGCLDLIYAVYDGSFDRISFEQKPSAAIGLRWHLNDQDQAVATNSLEKLPLSAEQKALADQTADQMKKHLLDLRRFIQTSISESETL